MKVYVHYEGQEVLPDYTLRLECDDKTNIYSLKQKFVESYNAKYKENYLDADTLCVKSEDGKQLHEQSLVCNVLKPKDDVFLWPIPGNPSLKALDVEMQKAYLELQLESQRVHSKEQAIGLVKKIEGYVQMATAYVRQNKYKAAVTIYETILRAVPSEMNSLFHLAEIFCSAEKYDVALNYLLKGLEYYPDLIEFHIKTGEAYLENGDSENALKYFSSASKLAQQDNKMLDRLKVLMSRALQQRGRPGDEEVAFQLVASILQQNEQHPEALLEYGKLVHNKGKRDEAVRVFLKLLVLRPDDTNVRKNLAKVVKGGNGVKLVEAELKQASSIAPALVFLATVIKDHGAIEESTALYKKGYEMQRENVSYCLSYVHSLELEYKYQLAFQQIQLFCAQNQGAAVGPLTCGHVYHVIKDVKDIYDLTHVRNVASKLEQQTLPTSTSNAEYSATELDLLALMFTLVKLLYIAGALELIPPLSSLIDAARGTRELHKTSIRNENAYYSCIVQLLQYHPLPLKLPTVAAEDVIYVAGDSHSMTPAWHTITVNGKEKLLKPMLVTGLKVWHLRPSSDFFPKYNFYTVINSIPKGSSVIFLFGEIDCREGLLMAVEKCKYDNLEEAVNVSVDIYIKVLNELVQKRKFKVYVHPVVPVLNETRNTVKLFNKILTQKLQQNRKLQLLDIFPQLLKGDGFNTEYALDGTHMNPKYLPLIANSLSSLLSKK